MDYQAAADYKKIILAMFEHSIDAYIKLQHYKTRKRKFEKENFLNSVDFLFLDLYQLECFEDTEGNYMTPQQLISMVKPTYSIFAARDHLISKSNEYWSNKYMKTLIYPEAITYKGRVYIIELSDSFKLDHVTNTIYVNSEQNEQNEKEFLSTLFSFAKTFDPEETETNILYELLKMNDIKFNY